MANPTFGKSSWSSSGNTKPVSTSANSHGKSRPGAMEPATRKTSGILPSSAAPRAEHGSLFDAVPLKYRKKTRRGKRNSKKFSETTTDKTFDILHTNIRGFLSKKTSFKSIYQKINPSVITINEVGLTKDKKISLPGYYSYNKNRKTQAMGGVATVIRKNEAAFAINVAEGNDTFIITRLVQFVIPINIINVYGLEEGRNSNNDIKDG